MAGIQMKEGEVTSTIYAMVGISLLWKKVLSEILFKFYSFYTNGGPSLQTVAPIASSPFNQI